MPPPLCLSDAGTTAGSSLKTSRGLGTPAGRCEARGPLRPDSIPKGRLDPGGWTPQTAHEDVGGQLAVPESLIIVHRFFKGELLAGFDRRFSGGQADRVA